MGVSYLFCSLTRFLLPNQLSCSLQLGGQKQFNQIQDIECRFRFRFSAHGETLKLIDVGVKISHIQIQIQIQFLCAHAVWFQATYMLKSYTCQNTHAETSSQFFMCMLQLDFWFDASSPKRHKILHLACVA